MKTIELTGQVDAQHRLIAQVPADVPPGPVKLTVELPDEEDEGCWGGAIATSWGNDWNDSREDIYSFEDGKPSR